MTVMTKPAIHPQSRTIDGVSIRFAESELRGDHALLLSPWPESLYAFEAIWSRLAEHAHLVAIDLPGFGRSERLHERLPLSKLAIIERGHFVWEDAADEYAALVSAWWDGGYAAVERRA